MSGRTLQRKRNRWIVPAIIVASIVVAAFIFVGVIRDEQPNQADNVEYLDLGPGEVMPNVGDLLDNSIEERPAPDVTTSSEKGTQDKTAQSDYSDPAKCKGQLRTDDLVYRPDESDKGQLRTDDLVYRPGKNQKGQERTDDLVYRPGDACAGDLEESVFVEDAS